MVKKKTGQNRQFYLPDAINTALEQAHNDAIQRNPATGSLSQFTAQLIWEALENRSNERNTDGT